MPRRSVQMLIGRIERGEGDIDDPEPADGPVAAAGVNHNGHAGAHTVALAVQFHLAFTFQKVIDLGRPLVVMDASILLNLHDVQGCRRPWKIGERTARRAARARLRS
jgi:hypothetical protein